MNTLHLARNSTKILQNYLFQEFFCNHFGQDGTHPHTPPMESLILSGHYSRDWSEYVNVIGVTSEPFAREFR